MPIRERKNKNSTVYEVRFQYKDRYGRTKNYNKSGFARKRDAKIHERRMRNYILDGMYISKNKKTIDNLFNDYIANDLNISGQTKNIREIYYNKHLKKVIGQILVNRIDYDIIQSMFNDFGKIYSKATCENMLKVLNAMFRFAFNNKYINRLPYSRIKITGYTKRKDEQWNISIKEYENLLESVKMSKYKGNTLRFKSYAASFRIAYYTGMRLGEVCALKWDDIDFNNNTISISKSVYKDLKTKELIVKDAKTDASNDIIPLPTKLKDFLLEWQYENKSEYVIADNDLSIINPGLIKGYLENYSRNRDIKIHYHLFRHNFATMLYDNNIDVKTAQRLLRHEDYKTTLDVYTHIKNSRLDTVVNAIFS